MPLEQEVNALKARLGRAEDRARELEASKVSLFLTCSRRLALRLPPLHGVSSSLPPLVYSRSFSGIINTEASLAAAGSGAKEPQGERLLKGQSGR